MILLNPGIDPKLIFKKLKEEDDDDDEYEDEDEGEEKEEEETIKFYNSYI